MPTADSTKDIFMEKEYFIYKGFRCVCIGFKNYEIRHYYYKSFYDNELNKYKKKLLYKVLSVGFSDKEACIKWINERK